MRELTIKEFSFVSGGDGNKSPPSPSPDKPDQPQPDEDQLRDPREAFDWLDRLCDGIGMIPGPVGSYFGAVCDAAVETGREGGQKIDEERRKKEEILREI